MASLYFAALFQHLGLIQQAVDGHGCQVGHGELTQAAAQLAKAGANAVNNDYISHTLVAS